jgi:fucose 4-O-acetylase-like acetyltransferase
MPAPISRFLSHKFRFYTFICIALLLFVHGYNLNEGYLEPSTTVREPLTFTTWFEYFMANGILRFRIPMLFIISGYIYAMKDKAPYGLLVSKRATTLIVPYLLWSAIGLLVTYLWQQHPVTARAVSEAGIDQLGDNRSYSEIGWGGIWFRWLRAPIAFQLWFILALFLYNVSYPLIKWVVLKHPVPWFAFTFFLWVTQFSFLFIDGIGLLFFSTGILLQKMDVNLEKKPEWLSMYLAWLLFIGFSVIKTFMAFELEPYARLTYWVLNILHDGSVLSGILAVWFGVDKLVKWCMRRRSFIWASSFSFFIFGLHVPLVIYLTRLLFRYGSALPNYRLVMYLVAPIITLSFCILTGAVIRRLFPRFYYLLTGGRGAGLSV